MSYCWLLSYTNVFCVQNINDVICICNSDPHISGVILIKYQCLSYVDHFRGSLSDLLSHPNMFVSGYLALTKYIGSTVVLILVNSFPLLCVTLPFFHSHVQKNQWFLGWAACGLGLIYPRFHTTQKVKQQRQSLEMRFLALNFYWFNSNYFLLIACSCMFSTSSLFS